MLKAQRGSSPRRRAEKGILEAGLRAGVELPYSCRSGVCSTCRAKFVAGEAAMDVNFALEDYEVARGFVLTCHNYLVTDNVTVDYQRTIAASWTRRNSYTSATLPHHECAANPASPFGGRHGGDPRGHHQVGGTV